MKQNNFYPFGLSLTNIVLYGLDRFYLALSWSFVSLKLYKHMEVW